MKSLLVLSAVLSFTFCHAQQRKATVTQTAFGSFGRSTVQNGKTIEPILAQKKTKDGGKATLVKFKPVKTKAKTEKVFDEAVKFSVFPNPAHNEINIKVAGGMGQVTGDRYIVRIKNLVGQNVYEESFEGAQFKIDASQLPKGFFIVELSSPANQTTGAQKVIVQ